jgi:hypothetical protein
LGGSLQAAMALASKEDAVFIRRLREKGVIGSCYATAFILSLAKDALHENRLLHPSSFAKLRMKKKRAQDEEI